MLRALPAIIALVVLTTACTQRMVCPAYQSAFIYDKDELRKKFSYFKEDSTPKVYAANKTKYLIAEPVSYRKKVRSLQTVAAKPVNVVVPDSFNIEKEGLLGEEGDAAVDAGSALDMAARSVVDSTFVVDVPKKDSVAAEDSTYVISKDREVRLLKYNFPDSLKFDASTGKYMPEKPKYAVVNVTFNVDQDNYMWYLRDYLVLPDVRLSKLKPDDEETESEDGEKATKKKGGFFKNLFRKKKKEQEEPVETAPPPKSEEEEFDFIDEDGTPENEPPPAVEPTDKPKKKKEKRSRKKEEPAEEKEPVTDPDEKTLPEKVDEDGF